MMLGGKQGCHSSKADVHLFLCLFIAGNWQKQKHTWMISHCSDS
jgi:hypothetical protein